MQGAWHFLDSLVLPRSYWEKPQWPLHAEAVNADILLLQNKVPSHMVHSEEVVYGKDDFKQRAAGPCLASHPRKARLSPAQRPAVSL